MSRVINTEEPGKQRRHLRRTIAEALRRLSQKEEIDGEAKDLAALIVFSLRAIDEGLEDTTRAWEARNYYVKADRFRMRWAWAGKSAAELTEIIKAGQWDQLRNSLIDLFPRFSDITVARLVRPASLWDGCYERLMNESQ